MNPRTNDVLITVSAAAQSEAFPRKKYSAARLGFKGPRNVQRWCSEDYAAGSPAHRFGQAIMASDDPFRLAAFAEVTAIQSRLEKQSTADLIIRYRELERADALHEGVDNALKVDPTATWLDRADAAEADAAHELERAAIARELEIRRVPPSALWSDN